ncbi:hypothetical protein QNJ95_01050 [Bradyrhizobium elkanii]|uniref:hypothetical protein n=1 Tax=Bradyrhizobium TaxID=374 RepID=UPI0027120798|nr:hypothetical protein [Bradyrhizobium elkanii]WLA40200.1 hypothetical protein QNJ95_01050 [Bradyrhizobium elkanii]
MILYFVTSPAHIPTGEKKKVQEMNANWTLQATSQVQTEDPDSCASLGIKMAKEFEPVNTSTIRLYCVCPKGSESEVCFNKEEKRAANERSNFVKSNKGKAGFTEPAKVQTNSPRLVPIGPDTPDPLERRGSHSE